MMRFFNFLAKKISYTFAVAFITIIGGWVSGFIGFFLGSSFIIMSYEKLTVYFIKWLPIAVAIPTFLHYVEFGFLTPLRIPATFRSLRVVNKTLRGNQDIPTSVLIKPKALIGFRLKFFAFVWLAVIILLPLVALIEKGRSAGEFDKDSCGIL